MAIVQMEEPDMAAMFQNAGTAETEIGKINNKTSFILGYYGLGFTNLQDVTIASEIMAGSGLEANGVFYAINADYPPEGIGVFLYFTETKKFAWNDIRPQWSGVKRGWYHGNDRCVLKIYGGKKVCMYAQDAAAWNAADMPAGPRPVTESLVYTHKVIGSKELTLSPGWYRFKGVSGGGNGGSGGDGGGGAAGTGQPGRTGQTGGNGGGNSLFAGSGARGQLGEAGQAYGGSQSGGHGAGGNGGNGGGGGAGAYTSFDFYLWDTTTISLYCPGPGGDASCNPNVVPSCRTGEQEVEPGNNGSGINGGAGHTVSGIVYGGGGKGGNGGFGGAASSSSGSSGTSGSPGQQGISLLYRLL